MKKLLTTILVLAAFLLAFTPLGLAASDSTPVTVTIKPRQSLQIKSNGSTDSSNMVESVFHIPEPSNEDIRRGYIKEIGAIELVAASDIQWEVQVKAMDSSLGIGEDGHEKSVSDLSVRARGIFKRISTDSTTIASGQPGKHQLNIDYKVQYDKDYKPGDYAARLVYTITSTK